MRLHYLELGRGYEPFSLINKRRTVDDPITDYIKARLTARQKLSQVIQIKLKG
jgi:hypothetical protein